MEWNTERVSTGGRVEKGERDEVEKVLEVEGNRGARKATGAKLSGGGCGWRSGRVKKREKVEKIVEGD